MEALIVAATQKILAAISEAVRYADKYSLVCAQSGAAARRAMAERAFDLVVVNSVLGDEHGHELAVNAADRHEGGVIFIEAAERADEVCAALEDYGIIVVPRPISRHLLHTAVKMVGATNRRISGLRVENRDLHRKIEDIRLVNRAKLVLMQNMQLTEEQAHKYIEKQAMDQRLPRRAVATDILKTYE